MRILIFVAGALLISCEGPARGGQVSSRAPSTPTVSLHTALAAGELTLTDVRGNGGSSGAVLDGTLRNTTQRRARVSVMLNHPLYLANRTATAQNMIATAIYERGGRYWVDDNDEPFITIPADGTTPITLNGYCLNFDLDNPAASDRLIIEPVPEDIRGIAARLLAYERNTLDESQSVVRAQIALWIAQGHTPAEIRERFPFTDADLDAARRVLAGVF